MGVKLGERPELILVGLFESTVTLSISSRESNILTTERSEAFWSTGFAAIPPRTSTPDAQVVVRPARLPLSIFTRGLLSECSEPSLAAGPTSKSSSRDDHRARSRTPSDLLSRPGP